jgi:alpha-glucosidase (family GH31 glycosyl hydrolase)
MDLTFPLPIIPNRAAATLTIKTTATQKRLWWNWEYDRHSYPDWPQFVKQLREEYGIRVMTYINPFMTDVETGGKPNGSWSKNYFREAASRGYLVKRWLKGDADGTPDDGSAKKGKQKWKLVDYLVSSGPGLHAGMIDLSNPEAYQWYKDLIKDNMIRHGVSGWMVTIRCCVVSKC